MSEYEGQQPPPQQPYPQQPPAQQPPQPEWQQQPAPQPEWQQQPAPQADWQQPVAAQGVRASQTGQVPPGAVAAAQGAPKANIFSDPSELAATGLIAAVLFAVLGGVVNFFADPGFGRGFDSRLLSFTATVDVGDVALLGIAVALLLLTPDPPGGMGRPMLLNVTAALAAIIAAEGVIRAIVVISNGGDALSGLAGFLATLGVAIAAATVSFYAAKESFLKKEAEAAPAA